MALARMLDARLASDPAPPLVTCYDDATGERVELSTATFANWVSKTCGLLEARGVRPGDRVGLLLPVHWQSLVLLASCWRLGALACPAPEGELAIAFASPERLEEALDVAPEVLGLALAPMAGRLQSVPLGAEDYAVEVPVYADSWSGAYPPSVEEVTDPALAGRRVLLADPTWERASVALMTALASGGSIVLVRNADAALLERKAETEHAELI